MGTAAMPSHPLNTKQFPFSRVCVCRIQALELFLWSRHVLEAVSEGGASPCAAVSVCPRLWQGWLSSCRAIAAPAWCRALEGSGCAHPCLEQTRGVPGLGAE